MAIHEHLSRIPKAELRSMGWTKARELAKVARRERHGFDWTRILIRGFAGKCSNAMAGDARNAEFPEISRSIIGSREAFWEAMGRKS